MWYFCSMMFPYVLDVLWGSMYTTQVNTAFPARLYPRRMKISQMEIISLKMRPYNFLSSCSEVLEDERVSIANKRGFFYTYQVIQSVFNGPMCLSRRHLGFHFRVVFGRRKVSHREGEDLKKGMVEIFFGTPIFLSTLF